MVRVSLLDYYNAFQVEREEYTAYWYSGPDKHVCTEDPLEFYELMGETMQHNIRVIAWAAANKTPFYFSNTIFENIIARSDGWYRDFSTQELVMYPPGYEFKEYKQQGDEIEEFITNILVAPWLDTEIC